jgi:hypothetical protein
VTGGSHDIVGTEIIRAKTARTAFTLESRPPFRGAGGQRHVSSSILK